jgi:hypothetical protein
MLKASLSKNRAKSSGIEAIAVCFERFDSPAEPMIANKTKTSDVINTGKRLLTTRRAASLADNMFKDSKER